MRLADSDCNLTRSSRIIICHRLILFPTINFLTSNLNFFAAIGASCCIVICLSSCYTTVFLEIICISTARTCLSIKITQQNLSHNFCITGTDVSFVNSNSLPYSEKKQRSG